MIYRPKLSPLEREWVSVWLFGTKERHRHRQSAGGKGEDRGMVGQMLPGPRRQGGHGMAGRGPCDSSHHAASLKRSRGGPHNSRESKSRTHVCKYPQGRIFDPPKHGPGFRVIGGSIGRLPRIGIGASAKPTRLSRRPHKSRRPIPQANNRSSWRRLRLKIVKRAVTLYFHFAEAG